MTTVPAPPCLPADVDAVTEEVRAAQSALVTAITGDAAADACTVLNSLSRRCHGHPVLRSELIRLYDHQHTVQPSGASDEVVLQLQHDNAFAFKEILETVGVPASCLVPVLRTVTATSSDGTVTQQEQADPTAWLASSQCAMLMRWFKRAAAASHKARPLLAADGVGAHTLHAGPHGLPQSEQEAADGGRMPSNKRQRRWIQSEAFQPLLEELKSDADPADLPRLSALLMPRVQPATGIDANTLTCMHAVIGRKDGAAATPTVNVLTADDAQGTQKRAFQDMVTLVSDHLVARVAAVLTSGSHRASEGDRVPSVMEAREAALKVIKLDPEVFTKYLYMFSSYNDVFKLPEGGVPRREWEEFSQGDFKDCVKGLSGAFTAVWGYKTDKMATQALRIVSDYYRLDECRTYPGGWPAIWTGIVVRKLKTCINNLDDELRGGTRTSENWATALEMKNLEFTDSTVVATYRQNFLFLSGMKERGTLSVDTTANPDALLARRSGLDMNTILALIAKQGGGKANTGGGKAFTGTCNKCGKTGHRARECPDAKKRGGGQTGSGDSKKKAGGESFTQGLHACSKVFNAFVVGVNKPKACLFQSCSKKGCSKSASDCSKSTPGRECSHDDADQLTKAELAAYVKSSTEVSGRLQEDKPSSNASMRRIHDKHGLHTVVDAMP